MWAYTGLQSAGFISKTYATEGFGFAAIRPYANLWKIFRDVAYMFLVIVLVAIGFMIMFRMKMNPQTVISIENALPRIVVALILVTFSFAIAGLLIDLMYVVIVLIISLLSNGGTYYNTTQFQNEYVVADIGRLFKDVACRYGYDPTGIAPIIADSIIGIIPPYIAVILRVMIGIIAVFAVNGQLDNILLRRVGEAFGIGSVAGSDLKPLLRLFSIPVSFATIFIVFFIGMLVIFPLLMWLFIIFTILFLAIRIFILLFTSYIKLILTIIISPFLLMFEAVPGKSPFTSWFKNIVGYLLGFPITIAVCLIGYIIINSSLPSTYNPMYLPYLYGIHSNSFKILIGMEIGRAHV